MRQSRAEEKVLAGTMQSQGTSVQQGGVRRGWPQQGAFRGGWAPRGGWRGGDRGEMQLQMQILTGAETGSERMAVDWAKIRAQVVYHQCGKKEHYMRECGKEARIRILELEKQVEELKGKGGQ